MPLVRVSNGGSDSQPIPYQYGFRRDVNSGLIDVYYHTNDIIDKGFTKVQLVVSQGGIYATNFGGINIIDGNVHNISSVLTPDSSVSWFAYANSNSNVIAHIVFS